MVGSPSPSESPSDSLSTTSMKKICLHCLRWPSVKSSSHLKHLSSLRRCAISDGERHMELGAGLLTEAIDAASTVAGDEQLDLLRL
jgi:hypothetical protein